MREGDIFEISIRRFFRNEEEMAFPTTRILLKVDDPDIAKRETGDLIEAIVDQLEAKTCLARPMRQMTQAEVNAIYDYEMNASEQEAEEEFIKRETQGMTKQ